MTKLIKRAIRRRLDEMSASGAFLKGMGRTLDLGATLDHGDLLGEGEWSWKADLDALNRDLARAYETVHFERQNARG